MKFSPFSPHYLASSSVDSLNIWDLRENDENSLFFKHIGHVGSVVDFDWNKESNWSLISASDDIN